MPAKLPRPLPKCDVQSDRYPDDDYYIEQWKRTILNRIDREWGCDVKIWHDEYCGLPEWDPFTNRCAEHSPDNGGWNA